MRSFLLALAVAFAGMIPAAAHAGWLVEGSVGKGVKVSPSPVKAEQMTVMIAPGWSTPGIAILRLQLGFLGNMPDTSDSKMNLQLRPMLTVKAPILPLFGRLIVAVNNLVERDGQKREVAFGAAGGLRFGLGPIAVFAEVGVLPAINRQVSTTTGTEKKVAWILEGRLGAALEF